MRNKIEEEGKIKVENKQNDKVMQEFKIYKEEKNIGLSYSGFEKMNLERKIEVFKVLFSNYQNYFSWYCVKEIKMTNDGLYIFVCMIYIGMA